MSAVAGAHVGEAVSSDVAPVLSVNNIEVIYDRVILVLKGVNRVVYDISSKPPSTIEWE